MEVDVPAVRFRSHANFHALEYPRITLCINVVCSHIPVNVEILPHSFVPRDVEQIVLLGVFAKSHRAAASLAVHEHRIRLDCDGGRGALPDVIDHADLYDVAGRYSKQPIQDHAGVNLVAARAVFRQDRDPRAVR